MGIATNSVMFGAALDALALPCDVAILSAVRLATDDSGVASRSASIGLGVIGCGTDDPFACPSLIIDATESVVVAAETTVVKGVAMLENLEAAPEDLGDVEGEAMLESPQAAPENLGDMVLIPAGEFQMGCDESNPNETCSSDEQPLHTVYLDEYAIGKYEVTNAQYAEFLNAEGNQEEGGEPWLEAEDSDVRIHKDEGVWRVDVGYEDHPVVEVSWYGAWAYADWVGGRLPTEAEWEKAARGSSDTRKYPWGNEDPDCSRLNYNNCVGNTTPVGSYPSGTSPYGVMDMAGNVNEWVDDWYDRDYYEISPYENPPGPASGDYRVWRGGAFFDRRDYVDSRSYIRCAYRFENYPHLRPWSLSLLGFRVVVSP